jgi:hypothetical protein
MNRRVVRPDARIEVSRETRPETVRVLPGGAVLNILQWVKEETARFTVEGEGADVWCCPKAEVDDHTTAAGARVA